MQKCKNAKMQKCKNAKNAKKCKNAKMQKMSVKVKRSWWV
jgi:hypothetical protein